MSAPDYAEALEGWRAWCVGPDLRLSSPVFGDAWEPGRALAATCTHGHAAPSAWCACGIYAARDLREALRYLVGRDDAGTLCRVVGRVRLWGVVVEAERGWRGACAYPSRLWAQEPAVARALRRYRVPVSMRRLPRR